MRVIVLLRRKRGSGATATLIAVTNPMGAFAPRVTCCHGDAIYQHTIAARVTTPWLWYSTLAAGPHRRCAKVPRKPRRGAGAVLFCWRSGLICLVGVTSGAQMATAVDKEIDDVEDDGHLRGRLCAIARHRCHIHGPAAACSC